MLLTQLSRWEGNIIAMVNINRNKLINSARFSLLSTGKWAAKKKEIKFPFVTKKASTLIREMMLSAVTKAVFTLFDAVINSLAMWVTLGLTPGDITWENHKFTEHFLDEIFVFSLRQLRRPSIYIFPFNESVKNRFIDFNSFSRLKGQWTKLSLHVKATLSDVVTE